MSEWDFERRLREAQETIRRLQQEIEKRTADAAQSEQFIKQTQQALESAQAAVRRMQALQDGLVERINKTDAQNVELRSQLIKIIQDNNKRIAQVSADNERRIHDVSAMLEEEIAAVREGTADAIAANNRKIERAMNNMAQQLQTEITSLASDLQAQVNNANARLGAVEAKIANLDQDFATSLSMAREYEVQAEAILEEVRASKHSSVLLPQRIAEVQDDLNDAANEIANANTSPVNAPVARLVAKRAFVEALRLRQEMIAAEQEWQLHHQLAQQAVIAAKAQADKLDVFEIEDSGETCKVDSNEWSNGDFDDIVEVLSGVEKTLAGAGVDDLTIEQLDDLARVAEQVSVDLQTTASFAGRAILASDDRSIVVGDIADALCEALDLKLVQDGFEGEDRRAGMRAHLKNTATGMEIVITVEPVMEAGKIGQGLLVDVVDWGAGAAMEEVRTQIKQEIDNTLARIGIPVNAAASSEGATAPGDRAACHQRADMHAWQTAEATVLSQGATLPSLSEAKTALSS